MNQSLLDIGLLAEVVGRRYLSNEKVDLNKIAEENGITLVHGSYEKYFLGQLVYINKKFYVVLNNDLLSNSERGRVRFTIAHELGHYFIDNHKSNLSSGISLSFNNNLTDYEVRQFDIEANHFASHLLMPQTLFRRHAAKMEVGMQSILNLKTKFDTSIYSTSKHYIHLDVSSSVLIKWCPDARCEYCAYSKSFSDYSGIRWKLPLKYDVTYIGEQMKAAEAIDIGYVERATQLSYWVSSIQPGTAKDCTGLEQTIKLGQYGGLTLLTFAKS